MSLVGSLEDLGLGDILQIVSLSRKSGLLLLRSDAGEGRIVFRDGLVRAGYVKGEPEDLRGLVVDAGFVDEAAFERAVEMAAARKMSLAEALAECTTLSAERVESLRREHVERAVMGMFRWRTGEFSFEVRDELDPRDSELLLPTGINAQYLTMEATRLGDEAGPDRIDADDEEPVFSGEESAEEFDAQDDPNEATTPDAHEVVALAAARAEVPDDDALPEAEIEEVAGDQEGDTELAAVVAEPEPEPAPAPAPPAAQSSVPLVVVDPDLAALEWIKAQLKGQFARIHIFQRTESAVDRVRQYLRRGQPPAVLVSAQAPLELGSGIRDVADLVARLRALAPSMPVVALHDGTSGDVSLRRANAVVTRPPTHRLVERRAEVKQAAAGERLREDLRPFAEGGGARGPNAVPAPGAESAASLRRLKELSARLRDPTMRADVLSLVLEFASGCFSRVAIFMVRDDRAVGIAQVGLARAGGPGDDAVFQQLSLAAHDPACFGNVIEQRSALRVAPSAADRPLLECLGDRVPGEVYVAPIESGGHIAALLYADNLPGGEPLGDTTALEIVLHEAGLALDRALLERALAASGSASQPG